MKIREYLIIGLICIYTAPCWADRCLSPCYSRCSSDCYSYYQNRYTLYENHRFEWITNVFNDVLCDYSIYYGKDNLKSFAGVLMATGVLANTQNDNQICRSWQRDWRCDTSNQFFRPFMEVGKINYIKFYVGGMVLGHFAQKYCAGNIMYLWGYRALRAMLILSPQEFFFTWLLGSGRPECDQESRWQYCNKGGKSGCSGHAFNGALPFLTMAHMTENCALRYGLYIVSALPGLSRVNKNAHYFSQVFLGWGLAYLATKVVSDADCYRECAFRMSVSPTRYGDGAMLYAQYKF